MKRSPSNTNGEEDGTYKKGRCRCTGVPNEKKEVERPVFGKIVSPVESGVYLYSVGASGKAGHKGK